jgi:FG-GAP-like repeat
MPRLTCLATATIALASQSAIADFTGFTVVRSAIDGVEADYRVMMVYATFDSPEDRLLYVFNTRLEAAGSTAPRLFQASSVDEEIPPSFAPLAFPAQGERWIVDSYITIGAEQGEFANGTVTDPDFDHEGAATGQGIARGGWYNLPPNNGLGVAGDDRKVLIGQFTILESDFTQDAAVSFSATLAIAAGPALVYANPTAYWNFAEPAATPEYCMDDHDGDTLSDLTFFHTPSRRMVGWLLQGNSIKQSGVFPFLGPSGSTLHGVGDADGDGRADVLWRNTATGTAHISLINGLESAPAQLVDRAATASWKTLGFTDIDGDRRADILLYHPGQSRVTAWTLAGTTESVSTALGQFSGAQPIAVSDLDRDGRADIVWRASDGGIWIWFLNGAAAPRIERIQGAVASTAWQLVGSADFDGDGNPDLFWRSKTNGTLVVWRMQAEMRLAVDRLAGNRSSVWKLEATPDADGDGRHEAVWRHATTGAMAIWSFQSYPAYTVAPLPTATPAWRMSSMGEALAH